MRISVNKEIIIYTVVVLLLTSLICFISYQLDDSNFSILSVLIPSIVALIFTAITAGKKGLKELFVKQTFRKVGIKWLIISAIGIPLLASLAILTTSNFDVLSFNLRTTQLLPQIIVIILIAVGEEYGWRGFLLPRFMKKYNLLISCIMLGLIWGVWHFPAYLIGTGVPQDMNFLIFMVWVVLGSLFIGWIYYYTRSVLTSIIAHISANMAFNYLLILPEFTGSISTFMIFLLYLSLLLIAVFATRRKELLINPK